MRNKLLVLGMFFAWACANNQRVNTHPRDVYDQSQDATGLQDVFEAETGGLDTGDAVFDTADGKDRLKPVGLAAYVNPMIGSGGNGANIGNAFVGAALPFSLAKPGPDTRSKYGAISQFHTDGYWYGDDRVVAFSQMHLHGTGALDYGNLGLLPVEKGHESEYMAGKYFPKFEHSGERAFPGYYGVRLKNGILAEMTTTGKAAIHRYTFNQDTGLVGIDLAHQLGKDPVTRMEAEISIEKQMVTGSLLAKGSLSGRNGGFMLYFAIHLDQPFTVFKVDKQKGYKILLKTNAKQVVIHVGISMVDARGALNNLKHTEDTGFDQAVMAAVAQWNHYLGAIELTDPGSVDPVIFYTSLYHALLMPDDLADTDGRYMGFSEHIHQGKRFFSDFSGWDTFRTVHPLYCLVYPQDQTDMLKSLVLIMKQGGYIPSWAVAHGYGNSMFGSPGQIIMADSYLRGLTEFDAAAALKNMVDIANGARGNGFSGRDGVDDYLKYHYLPADKHDNSVSKTLEVSLADFCISQLADTLGQKDVAQEFNARSKYWQNLYDPKTGFFRPKDSDGHFLEPFNPTYLEDQHAYSEGSPWQYRFDVPHATQELSTLMGGVDKFTANLNEFFAKSKLEITPYFDSYYWHGNEPDLPAPFMFVEVGQGRYTDKWVAGILKGYYKNEPIGIAGNDDAGTLGAWYVLASLGLFPRYCKGDYLLFAPAVRAAVLHLPGGDLKIQQGRGVMFNNKPLSKPFISTQKLAAGGVLTLPAPR